MDKETLQKAVTDAKCYKDILRNLGKSSSGNAYKLLKKQLEEFGIEVNFDTSETKRHGKKNPIEYYLRENVDCDSKNLKKRLIKEGLKEDKCEMCGIGNEWNGKPLTLQLDHINGDHSDNRLENLRILCPNCHSQTSTWGMKSR